MDNTELVLGNALNTVNIQLNSTRNKLNQTYNNLIGIPKRMSLKCANINDAKFVYNNLVEIQCGQHPDLEGKFINFEQTLWMIYKIYSIII